MTYSTLSVRRYCLVKGEAEGAAALMEIITACVQQSVQLPQTVLLRISLQAH